jgi:hypothetical protein
VLYQISLTAWIIEYAFRSKGQAKSGFLRSVPFTCSVSSPDYLVARLIIQFHPLRIGLPNKYGVRNCYGWTIPHKPSEFATRIGVALVS